MRFRTDNPPARLMRQLQLSPAWKIALLAGFVVQLLLILFVTSIGLNQLAATSENLKTVVDVHMRKQNLAKVMVVAARERTINLFRMVESDDLFDRDELYLRFTYNAEEFINARNELMKMPLNSRERELLDIQGKFSGIGVPIQNRIVEMLDTDNHQAEELLLKEAIPAQNKVLDALSRLDEETQNMSMLASSNAASAHDVARFWMYTLSGIALLIGFLVATAVIHYANRSSREREHLATHDALTGLPNRMLFKDRLEQSLARALRHNEMLGVMFIDIDRFKLVNDTLGHAGGDKLICEVAARLRTAVRAEDVVARLGGDEFVVVITEAQKLNQILQAVEKILALLSQPYQIAGRELFSSCSIGVSVYPNDGANSTVLIKNADTAMYHAKASGRNRFQLYDKAMNAMAEERLQLETDLHYALERNEFVFYYQPQLNLETGRIESVEALMRWNHPRKGLLAPGSFLELLEETGKIIDVGRKLVTEACRQVVDWQAAGFPGVCLAVNISGKEFWHEGLVQSIQAALEESGLKPGLLQLELTEGIFMQDTERAVNKILALKGLGIAVAIDDFGTGYSSLAHLKRFPLDCLKIDRYFVKDIQDALVNEAFISSILALCQGLHLDSVAEGVETPQQLERVRKLGCKTVQGMLISPPVPADQVVDLLTRDWEGYFAHMKAAAVDV